MPDVYIFMVKILICTAINYSHHTWFLILLYEPFFCELFKAGLSFFFCQTPFKSLVAKRESSDCRYLKMRMKL